MNDYTYYVCNYSDYTDLPKELFYGNSPTGTERKSLSGLKFITRSNDHAPAMGCLHWMNGNEPSFNHAEILIELNSSEWTVEEN